MLAFPKAISIIPKARQVIKKGCPTVLLLALLTVLYRRYWLGTFDLYLNPSCANDLELDIRDPYKCQALLTRGHWLDPPAEPYSARSFQQWQPAGCMMHEYTRKDIQACLKDQRIVYIGDSTVRQLFWATAKKLNATAADEDIREAAKHEDLTFDDGNVAVNFIWDPFLNSSGLRRELLSYLDDGLQDDAVIGGEAGLITVGGGLWYARHFESDSLDQYKDSIDYLASLLGIRRGSPPKLYLSPSVKGRKTGHHVYVTPVQVPFYEVLSPSRASAMTPAKINRMNEHLYNISISKGVKVAWSHSLMTWESQYAYEESGLHVIESVSTRRVDVLLNMRCNAKSTLSHGYPYNKTCCSAYETKNAFRKRLLLVCLSIAPIIIGIWTQSMVLFDFLPVLR